MCGDVSLREWLDREDRTVDSAECLHVFRQIVGMVSGAHSAGIVVENIRPSCFVMSGFHRVSFIESASCSTSGSRSASSGEGDYGGHCEEEEEEQQSQRHSDPDDGEKMEEREIGVEDLKKKAFPLKQVLAMEFKWYTSPEEMSEKPCSFESDIYRLGVLLFELFSTFSSIEEKLRTMSDLRHRFLPPQMLMKWPNLAPFVLRLLHPQPSSRPKISEVLKSELLNDTHDCFEDHEAAIEVHEKIENLEALQEFLVLLQKQKQDISKKLQDAINLISSDIEEVLRQKSIMKKCIIPFKVNNAEKLLLKDLDHTYDYNESSADSISLNSTKGFREIFHKNEEREIHSQSAEEQRSDVEIKDKRITSSKNLRLMENFCKLESAYFIGRPRTSNFSCDVQNRNNTAFIIDRESTLRNKGNSANNYNYKENTKHRKREYINPFLDGLCKYLSFSKVQLLADLKQGGLLNSSTLVCSVGFDRDKELFATAGVNRKIKIFECNAILNGDHDIHYPIVEIAAGSKLSSICWNSYIKSQIASSDFEGVVKIWDVTESKPFMEMQEHDRRVWSVDFSKSDPMKLVSGSDDGSVKLWNINQVRSTGTIKTKANVCSVQFSPGYGHFIAIGSADHRVYCYDLRHMSLPWCTLIGHTKTISYVKFLNSSTLVSASTDSSLKLWELSMSKSSMLENPLQTFTGHTNVKNFVGLSTFDEYIATGSESNEVFIYHNAFPMPMLSFNFSTDSMTGQENDDNSRFISSVCWHGESPTLLAANSTGNIKLLEMVRPL